MKRITLIFSRLAYSKPIRDERVWGAALCLCTTQLRIHYCNSAHATQTLPPVAIAMFIVAMWAWTDIEVKKMQVGVLSPNALSIANPLPSHMSTLCKATRHRTKA